MASGRVQLRRMASATATRMRRGLAQLVLLEVGDELLEILDGDAPAGAAAGKPGQVGGVQAQFVHARLHARRHVAGAGGVGRHGQAAHGRLHRFLRAAPWRGRCGAACVGSAVASSVGAGASRPEPRGVFRAGFEVTQHGADGIAFVQLRRGTFRTRPGQGEVTFMVALLVSTSMMSWSASTVSPALTRKLMMVASAMDSPSCGMMMGI